jgi:hypothetical protein
MTDRPEAKSAAGTSSEIARLHDDVDASSLPLFEAHADRLQCRLGCNACCIDELTVFEVEADRIRAEHADLLANAEPHAPGACAFLGDQGECRVYASRPYVCRTQGLPLRWFVEDVEGDVVERRSICDLNVPGEPIDALDDEACWLIGPVEHRLIGLQARIDGEGVKRVALRDLFRRD